MPLQTLIHHPPPPSPAPSPSNSPRRRRRNLRPPEDDVISWTATISDHARSGRLSSALSAFSSMLSSPVNPNHVTLITLFSACSHLPLARSLHAFALKRRRSSGDDDDDHRLLVLDTSVVGMYAKCGSSELARQVFDRMPVRNSVTYNTMIAGYMRNGNVDDALEVFDEMPVRDKVSWTAVIDGCVKNGLIEEALERFRAMLRAGVEPDYVTVIAVVSACAEAGALGQGLWVHRFVMGREFVENVRVMNSLVDMYSRCGRAELAFQVFSGMVKRSLVSWNSMVVGFAINGYCREAIEHFEMMQKEGFAPDGVSFTGVLTACSHAGWVEEGLRYYDQMRKACRIGVRIEHYGCVIDLLSRAGRLEEAMDVLKSMPMQPNEVVLTSLLAACRMHGNVALAERVVAQLKEMMPHCDSNYVLLSNIYAAAGRWDGVGEVRNKMKAIGVKKEPGFSCVEIDSDVHEFVAGDKKHPQSDDIYEMLELLFSEMNLYGYGLKMVSG